MGQHIFLDGIEIALHTFLRMTLLQLGHQRCDEHGAKVAFHLTNLSRQLLHELPLPQHYRAKLLHNLILAALQILALIFTEAFKFLWRHGTVTLQRDKRYIATGISLNAKTVVMCHTSKGFLKLADFVLVFFS